MLWLQLLHCLSNIIIVSFEGCNAFVKRSKLHFVQLESLLVEHSFRHRHWSNHLKLQGKGLSKSVAIWSSETKSQLVNSVFSNCMRNDLDWHLDFKRLLTFHFLVNWHIYHFANKASHILVIVNAKTAPCLPRPVGSVKNFKLRHDQLIWSYFKYSFRHLDKRSALVFPWLLLLAALEIYESIFKIFGPFWNIRLGLSILWMENFLKVKFFKETLHHSFALPRLFWICIFSLVGIKLVLKVLAPIWNFRLVFTFLLWEDLLIVKIFKETVNNFTEASLTSLASMASTTTSATTSSASATASVTSSLSTRLVFIKEGKHDIWCSTCLTDLEEWILMSQAFFASCAIVKVFKDTALVADSNNWIFSATITLNANVLDWGVFGLFESVLGSSS